MEITRELKGDVLELKVKGRLDAYWADHLSGELSSAVREGAHRIALDLSEVHYVSSAGIRVILSFYQQLKAIQGSFFVSKLSPQAGSILELAGLKDLLVAGEASSAATVTETRSRKLERESAVFEIFPIEEGGSFHCRVLGDPSLLVGCRFREEHAQRISFPDSTFGLGLGAFGGSFAECRERFGEFLAVAGTAAYLPTDGTNVSDYLVSSGVYVPELMVLYGVLCRGKFAYLARFEAGREAVSVTLNELVAASFKIAESEAIGLVLVAESAGLMGAALTRSPALEAASLAPFEYPETREWLSLTAERAFAQSLILAVGVADRRENRPLVPLLRPLGKGSGFHGHFHAAAFPFRPLKKGEINLATTVSTLFETERIQGVLHLLNDEREIGGAGQSEFIRGACWIGPISEIE